MELEKLKTVPAKGWSLRQRELLKKDFRGSGRRPEGCIRRLGEVWAHKQTLIEVGGLVGRRIGVPVQMGFQWGQVGPT